MPSPLAPYFNATLSVKAYAGPGHEDPDTGNWIDGASAPLTVRALLEPVSNLSTTGARLSSGLDVSEVYLQGWLVDPLDFPTGFDLPAQINATLDGRIGVFNCVLKPRSPWGDEKILGRMVEGVFRVVGGA